MILQDIDKVCAIIVSYNPNNRILQLYDSIKNKVDYIIIVDNNSEKTSKDTLLMLSNKDKVDIIYNLENEGIAKALNIGIKKADKLGFKWAFTFDQDSIPCDNMVETLINTYKECNDLNVSIIAPVYVDERFSDIYNVANNKTFIDKDVVITSGNLISIEILKKIGMYDENLFIDSVDFDICLRNKINGYRVIQNTNSYLYHSLGDEEYITLGLFKFKINRHSCIRKYYITRNHLYICKKYKKMFPVFCIKKNIFFFKFILSSIILENDRLENMSYIKKGIIDYKNCKYGKLDLQGE